jgi:hypothetical protein
MFIITIGYVRYFMWLLRVPPLIRELIIQINDMEAAHDSNNDIVKDSFPDKKVIGIFAARCNRTNRELSVFNNL